MRSIVSAITPGKWVPILFNLQTSLSLKDSSFLCSRDSQSTHPQSFCGTEMTSGSLKRISNINERARDFQTFRTQYMATVKPIHDAFVEPSKRYADVIIPTIKRNDNGVGAPNLGNKKDLDLWQVVVERIRLSIFNS